MAVETDKGVSAETPASGIEIDGERYEIPTMDTLTLDEERILYIYADCVVQDFVPAHPAWEENQQVAHTLAQMQRVRNPDFKRALAHIAYRRKHPEVTDDEINKAMGTVNALDLDLAMVSGEDDADPPAQSSQSEPLEQSETSEPTSSTHSGRPTANGSAEAAASPAAIGTTA